MPCSDSGKTAAYALGFCSDAIVLADMYSDGFASDGSEPFKGGVPAQSCRFEAGDGAISPLTRLLFTGRSSELNSSLLSDSRIGRRDSGRRTALVDFDGREARFRVSGLGLAGFV